MDHNNFLWEEQPFVYVQNPPKIKDLFFQTN